MPQFIKVEFETFVEYGTLAREFMSLRCADCTYEKLVAFSCKRHGFILSCSSRCMEKSAAYLVDQVIVSDSAAHPVLLMPVPFILRHDITRFLLKQAGMKLCSADTGAIILIQHFVEA